MKVFIYRNLKTGKWSIKALEGEHKGKVIAHAHSVQLTDVTPKVYESGRQRVIRAQRKYVHAGLVGQLGGLIEASYRYAPEVYRKYDREYFQLTDHEPSQVTYNPYKSRYFKRIDWDMVLRRADDVRFIGSSVYTLGGDYVAPRIAEEMEIDR